MIRLILALLLLASPALAQDPQADKVATLTAEAGGTTTRKHVSEEEVGFYQFADTDGVHQSSVFVVRSDDATMCLNQDLVGSDTGAAVTVRIIPDVTDETFAGSVPIFNFAKSECTALTGAQSRYYFEITNAPGSGVTAQLSVRGVAAPRVALNEDLNITGAVTLSQTLQTPEITMNATEFPSLVFKSTQDAALVDAAIRITTHESDDNSVLVFTVNVGNTEKAMLRLLGYGGFGYIYFGGDTDPATGLPANGVIVTEGGAMGVAGTGSIIATGLTTTSNIDLTSGLLKIVDCTGGPDTELCNQNTERGAICVDKTASAGSSFCHCAGVPAGWRCL